MIVFRNVYNQFEYAYIRWTHRWMMWIFFVVYFLICRILTSYSIFIFGSYVLPCGAFQMNSLKCLYNNCYERQQSFDSMVDGYLMCTVYSAYCQPFILVLFFLIALHCLSDWSLNLDLFLCQFIYFLHTNCIHLCLVKNEKCADIHYTLSIHVYCILYNVKIYLYPHPYRRKLHIKENDCLI